MYKIESLGDKAILKEWKRKENWKIFSTAYHKEGKEDD
jgi:hypothetical protein